MKNFVFLIFCMGFLSPLKATILNDMVGSFEVVSKDNSAYQMSLNIAEDGTTSYNLNVVSKYYNVSIKCEGVLAVVAEGLLRISRSSGSCLTTLLYKDGEKKTLMENIELYILLNGVKDFDNFSTSIFVYGTQASIPSESVVDFKNIL